MESLDGVRVVKLENREAFEEARVAAVVDRRQRHVIKGANARAAAAPATETLSARSSRR
jgi:subfamily B ATP-binding cassette protein MsbA